MKRRDKGVGDSSPREGGSEVTGDSIRISGNPCLYFIFIFGNPCLYIFSHALTYFKKTFL